MLVLPIYAVSFVDAVIILISIQRKKCTFYSRFLPSLIHCSMSSQNQPRNFFRSNYWCVIQLSSQLFYQTLQKGLVERKKGKKWGLWNEIKGQSTNKVIKEIITFACRLSLCVIALFSESFCGNIAFKVSSPSSFWGWMLNQIEASLVSRKLPSSRLFLIDLTKHNTLVVLASHLIENVIFHSIF